MNGGGDYLTVVGFVITPEPIFEWPLVYRGGFKLDDDWLFLVCDSILAALLA